MKMQITESMDIATPTLVSLAEIQAAYTRLRDVVLHTPLQRNANLSEIYGANIWLKREDLQVVRSYKLRGAYNRISQLLPEEAQRGVTCASAGNHAQGVAYSCHKLGINGKIFMPKTTPKQKVSKVAMFGKSMVEIVLVGDTYDDSYEAAMEDAAITGRVFVHPFDDYAVIAGQATVGVEILADAPESIDFLFAPIGGGGLISGVGSYMRQLSPRTKLIGVEPAGAPKMKRALEKGKVVTLSEIDKFIDGAAVKRVGERNFAICQHLLDDVVLIPEGKACTTILQLYNEEAIVVEPAGALSIAALDFYKDQIRGKNVVCVVSGSNNDITRTEEIKERSLLYEGLKHYFLIRFPQRPGAFKEFINEILGATDDITQFQYNRKNSLASGSTFVGIELAQKEDYPALIARMDAYGVDYEPVNNHPMLFNLLV